VSQQAVSTASDGAAPALPSRAYAWVVFALTFGLLLSDYMSRQVLNAIFPLLKEEWALSDTALGSLTGVVALMVGLLTFPLSLAADRIGRVVSVTIMALLWSAATLACGLAQNFEQMLAARLLVGVGEAAYGSVGLAILFSVFPASMRSTMTSSFMAGGIFGAVAGVALGGYIAQHFGWRMSFVVMAGLGFALGALYPLVVRAPRGGAPGRAPIKLGFGLLRAVFASKTVAITYLASGLQLFVIGAITAWMPSLLNRAYGMPPAQAAAVGGAFILVSGVGMIVCGVFTDRVTRAAPRRKLAMAAVFCAVTFAALTAAFLAPAGPLQLALAGLGVFFAAGSTGPSGAVVADGTDPALHATVLATLTLANNLLGLAPGPVITGMIADQSSLPDAFKIVPSLGLIACAAFLYARAASHRSN
jgi:MFS family permease